VFVLAGQKEHGSCDTGHRYPALVSLGLEQMKLEQWGVVPFKIMQKTSGGVQ